MISTSNCKLKIFDINGELILEKKYETCPWSVAWWNDRIAVGLENGEVHVYELEGYEPASATSQAPGSGAAIGIPAPALLAFLTPIVIKRARTRDLF